VDTCQANSLYSKFYSPNVISTGSSEIGENSYSVSGGPSVYRQTCTHTQHHNDMDIGVAVIDSYTHHVLQYLETIQKDSKQTLQDLVSPRRLFVSSPHELSVV
jgi:phosphatidylinositol glycan class K